MATTRPMETLSEPEHHARQTSARVVLDISGRTDRGTVRTENQDHFLVAQLWRVLSMTATSLPGRDSYRDSAESRGHVLAVADGMGGHAAGEAASRVALEAVEQLSTGALAALASGTRTAPEAIRQMVLECERRVRALGSPGAEHGPGTTLTAAFVVWPHLHVAHVGDSRCYLVRDGDAQQLTSDHTLGNAIREKADLQGNQAPEGVDHVLVNAVGGGGGEVFVESCAALLYPGDSLVLCSDGLSNGVDDRDIADIVSGASSAEQACEWLLARGLTEDGRDNVTVIVARSAAIS